MDTFERQEELNGSAQPVFPSVVIMPEEYGRQSAKSVDSREERATQTDTTSNETGTVSTRYENLDPAELWGLRGDLVNNYLEVQGGMPGLEEALGVDPERMKQYREGQKRLDEFKRKEALWYNGLSVLGDVLTAGHGGNVALRTPNSEAEKARKDNDKIEREDIGDGARLAAARRAVLERAGKAADDFIAKLMGTYRPSSEQTTGKTTGKTLDRSETVTGTRRYVGGSGSRSGKSGGYTVNGGTSTFYIRPKKNVNSPLPIVKTDVGERRVYNVPGYAIPDIVATVKARPDIMKLYQLEIGRTEKEDKMGGTRSYSVKYAPDEEFVNAYLNEMEAGRIDPPEWMKRDWGKYRTQESANVTETQAGNGKRDWAQYKVR